MSNSRFFRIQPDLHNATPELDNASPENLENLRDAGIRNADAHDATLEKIADILVNI